MQGCFIKGKISNYKSVFKIPIDKIIHVGKTLYMGNPVLIELLNNNFRFNSICHPCSHSRNKIFWKIKKDSYNTKKEENRNYKKIFTKILFMSFWYVYTLFFEIICIFMLFMHSSVSYISIHIKPSQTKNRTQNISREREYCLFANK